VFSAGTFLSLDADQLQAMGFVPPADRTNINLWECFAVLVAVLWGLLAAFLCDGV
jgi:hypothetical protein